MSVIDEILEANETYSRTHELRRLTPRPAPRDPDLPVPDRVLEQP